MKEYFLKYKFLQNIHFCEKIGIPQSTLKNWLRNNKAPTPLPIKEKEKTLLKIIANLEKL
jgi:DNA-binding transcriptional regulator YiaG